MDSTNNRPPALFIPSCAHLIKKQHLSKVDVLEKPHVYSWSPEEQEQKLEMFFLPKLLNHLFRSKSSLIDADVFISPLEKNYKHFIGIRDYGECAGWFQREGTRR